MKSPFLINSLAGLCCLTVVIAASVQWRQVVQLQSQERALRSDQSPPPATTVSRKEAAGEAPLTMEETKELMRLRNEVTRLKQRQKELEAARMENVKLRAWLSASPTNLPPSKVQLPPGYVLRRNAQFLGFHTPEATLQSFFWAMANRDVKVLMETVGGPTSQELTAELQRKGEEEFWKTPNALPGFVVTKSEPRSDKQQELRIEIVPGEEFKVVARKVGQQWKLFDFGPAPKTEY